MPRVVRFHLVRDILEQQAAEEAAALKPKPPTRKPTPADEVRMRRDNEIRRRYSKGVDESILAEQFGLPFSTISIILAAAGRPLR